MIVGYFQLLSGMSIFSNVGIFSERGILQLMAICLIIISMILACIAGVHMIKRLKDKDFQCTVILPICIIVVNLVVFILTYTIYDGVYFESRYLIVVYLAGVLLSCIALSNISDELLFKQAVRVIMVVIIFCESTGLVKHYYNEKIDIDAYNELYDQVHALDTPIAYVWGRTFWVTGRNFRTMDTDVIYKVLNLDDYANGIDHWGDYNFYDETSDWSGKTVLITTGPEFATLPDYLQNQYTYATSVGEYELYESDHNPFDLTAFDPSKKTNVNYMYTVGMGMQYGQMTADASYTTNGSEGYVMSLAATDMEDGEYQVSLDYSCDTLSGVRYPYLEAYQMDDGVVQQRVEMNKDSNQVQLNNVVVKDGMCNIEFRCFEPNGTILKLNKLIIEVD